MTIILNQLYVMGIMFCFGIFLLGAYHIYCSCIRNLFLDSMLITRLIDMLFGLLLGVLGFYLLYHVNWGEIRSYIVVSTIMGVFTGKYILNLIKGKK